MKRFSVFLSILVFGLSSVQAQKYFTREGKVSFHSDTPIEKIEASNSKATCVLNATDNHLEFAVLIKAFQFEKALMQEHFNENYMESATFPKAIFKGEITNMEKGSLQKDGAYDVQVEGELTIHGVTQTVSTPANIMVKDGQIVAEAIFDVKPEDYAIKIPAVVRNNIAETVRIAIKIDLQPFNP